jgi:hypothetical protein
MLCWVFRLVLMSRLKAPFLRGCLQAAAGIRPWCSPLLPNLSLARKFNKGVNNPILATENQGSYS